jgi:hypothetical protein
VPAWVESVAYWGLIASNGGLLAFAAVLVVGLVGEYKKPAAWSVKTFELLVIIGVVGELVFDGLIFGCSLTLDAVHSTELASANTIASAAYKAGNENRERAENLEKSNLSLQKELAETEKQLADSKLALQKQIESQGSRLSSVEEKTADRDVSAKQRRIVVSEINGHRRPITIVRLDDREPRTYADGIADTLTAAHFVVTKTDFGHTSPLTGVIVCENGGAEVNLFRVLARAGIATGRQPSTSQYTQSHPPECQPDFAPAPPIHIFVGQRK